MKTRAPRALCSRVVLCAALAFCCSPAAAGLLQWAPAATDAENDAIRYSATAPSDPIAHLQRSIDAGSTTLRFDAGSGYLNSLLHQLNIPVSSQALVFSRTSAQRDLISPATPRALYFDRDVYVAWVPGGPALEIASVDPTLGAIFYTLDQKNTPRPAFQRQTEACLHCHASPSLTGGVPGVLMKSVQPDETGEPIASAGALLTNDQSPLEQRWGGWYVTGTAAQRHRGNSLGRLDTRPYLSPHSDVVALMVLGHQAALHNLITQASYRARMALHFDRLRHTELGLDPESVSASTLSLIQRVGEPLFRAMLFVGEAPLTAPVSGSSAFAEDFAREGPRDHAGRSLRQLDLTRRLFRYPCSFLIYSPSFDALPVPLKAYVYRRLSEVLSGADRNVVFAHLSPEDRVAIKTILLDTKPDFAAWQAGQAAYERF